MGKGRAPCCDKTGLKKGPWTPAEDMRLMAFIQKHGHGNWRALPKLAGLLRCGKSCRLRWTNYLRPDIKRGNFTMEEEETIIKLHELLGNKWSKIASHMPGRTDNEIKNVWNTHLKKRVVSKGPNPSGNKEKKQSASSSSSSSSSSNSSISSYHDEGIGMRNEEQEHRLSASESPIKVMESKLGPLVETVPMKWSNDFWDMLDDRNSLESNNISDTYLQRSSISNGMSPVNEPMELTSFSSSSTCSSHVLQTNQVDGYGPEDHVRPPINFERPCELHDWVQEVIKQDTLGEKLEIPYEPNLDFWDMLGDDLGFFKSSGDTMYEVDEVQHSTLEEEYKKEVENMKWVAYLENELGLQATSDDNKGSLTQETAEPQVSNSSCEEILVKAEIDPVATYFQMCPYKSKF